MCTMQKQVATTTEIWTALELEWFYTTSWNLTIDHMKKWIATEVLILAQTSSAVSPLLDSQIDNLAHRKQFIGQLLKDSPIDSNFAKRLLFAIFLECALGLTCARQLIDIDEKVTKLHDGMFVVKKLTITSSVYTINWSSRKVKNLLIKLENMKISSIRLISPS